jgi:ABC-type glycerol-3-phosphate transport system substrate-binding protein
MSIKKQRLNVLFSFVCVMALMGFAACGQGGNAGAGASSSGVISDVAGELTLMMCARDGNYWVDIGSQNLTQDDLTSTNVAAAYATAKEYKKLYPNIKINIYAIIGGNNDDGPWEQRRENFRMEYGIYPDIYACDDMVSDMQRGLIADLSIFENEPNFRAFIPRVMDLMKIEGRQFGLPQYLIPYGVYINKSLAEANNIDVPDPNWTLAEYARFVSHHVPNEWYGTMGGFGEELAMVNTGTHDFSYQLLNRKPGEPFVNINSDPIRNLLRTFISWRGHSVYGNRDDGLVSDEFMDANWWWSWKFFLEGKLLTLPGDPWMMGQAAHPDPNFGNRAKIADWDYYPRPSTPYVGNHVGIVLDPFVIRNYAMDDGNPALSAEERAKLKIAWDFAAFWCGDTRAWEARANQLYRDGDAYRSSLNDSFPVVTGAEFDRQMQIWFLPELHQRFADKNKMPGFQYLLQLWEQGEFWDVSSKAYPWTYDFEGSRRSITYEWGNSWNVEIVGARNTDPNWLDQMYARLPQWNTTMNQRWEVEMRNVQEALNRYYPR